MSSSALTEVPNAEVPASDHSTGGGEGEVDEVEGRVRPCMKLRTRDGGAGLERSAEGNGAINEGDVARTPAMISFPLGVYGEWLYGVTALCKTGAAVLVLPAACGAASTSMAPSCGTPDDCSFAI
jgi:hypothetical protein